MKITVKKEGREGVYLVEKDEIKKFIKESGMEMIHNYPQPRSGMLMGADHTVESVFKYIDSAERVAILTGKAQVNNLGHALAVIIDDELEMFDIGQITDENLIINP